VEENVLMHPADVTVDRPCFNCTIALFLSAAVRLPAEHHYCFDYVPSTAYTCTYTPRCRVGTFTGWRPRRRCTAAIWAEFCTVQNYSSI